MVVRNILIYLKCKEKITDPTSVKFHLCECDVIKYQIPIERDINDDCFLTCEINTSTEATNRSTLNYASLAVDTWYKCVLQKNGLVYKVYPKVSITDENEDDNIIDSLLS